MRNKMKKEIKKSSQLDNIIAFIWAILVIGTFTYLIFWKNESPWWYIFACLLLCVDVYYYKETSIEE